MYLVIVQFTIALRYRNQNEELSTWKIALQIRLPAFDTPSSDFLNPRLMNIPETEKDSLRYTI